MTNRHQQVGFSEPGISEDEERIVIFPGILGNGLGGGVSELIGIADNEIVKGVPCHLGKGTVIPNLFFQIILFSHQNQYFKIGGKKL